MRVSPTAVVVLLLVLACAAPASSPSPLATSADAPIQISEVRLDRLPGGWGIGPSYTIVMTRGGLAAFEGGQDAPRLGRYSALLSVSRFDSLARTLAARPFFRQRRPSTTYQIFVSTHPSGRGEECVDFRKARVDLVIAGERRTLNDECQDPGFEAAYAAPIDALAAQLEWTRDLGP